MAAPSHYIIGWLVGWFYCMSTLIGLFYAEVSLIIMIFDYIWYKNVCGAFNKFPDFLCIDI